MKSYKNVIESLIISIIKVRQPIELEDDPKT